MAKNIYETITALEQLGDTAAAFLRDGYPKEDLSLISAQCLFARNRDQKCHIDCANFFESAGVTVAVNLMAKESSLNPKNPSYTEENIVKALETRADKLVMQGRITSHKCEHSSVNN